MAKSDLPAVLTANDLLDGDAVWWTGAGWSRSIEEAAIATDAAARDALTALIGDPAQEAAVVVPYLVTVARDCGATTPVVRREAIRAERAPTFAYAAPAGAPAPLTAAA